MKTIRYKFHNAVILILVLTLGLPGCGGSEDDDGEAGLGEALVCFITFFLFCPARETQPEAELVAGTAPSVSAMVPESAVSPTIELVWKDADEDHPVSGYRVYRDGELIADIAETRYTDSALESDTRYCYSIAAYDESMIETPLEEAVCATTSWRLDTVVSDIVAPRQALALDPLGGLHLAYLGSDESGQQHIHYAPLAAEIRQYLDLGPVETDFAERVAIAIDPAGAIHVGSGEQYFNNLSGGWRQEVGEGYNFSVLATDSHGFVHVVAADREGGFDHRFNAGGSWLSQRVGEGEWKQLALQVDRYDIVHIAYYNFESRELRYLSNHGGSWTTEVIAGGLDPVWHVDLDIDAGGRAHLTYRSGERVDTLTENDSGVSRTSLVYATNQSGVWQRETFEYGIGAGGMSAISVDATGHPHISYTNGAGGELKYLTFADGAWKSTTVDDGLAIEAECGLLADICGATDIAVDTSGTVHIVYPKAGGIVVATRG